MSWILHWFIQSSLSRYANTWNVVITATKKHCITPWTAAKWTKTVFYPLFFISCGGTPTQRREENFFAFRCSKNFSVERRPNVGRPVDFSNGSKTDWSIQRLDISFIDPNRSLWNYQPTKTGKSGKFCIRNNIIPHMIYVRASKRNQAPVPTEANTMFWSFWKYSVFRFLKIKSRSTKAVFEVNCLKNSALHRSCDA